MSHLAKAIDSEVVPLDRPFSSFDFVERRFMGSPPIRKLFSISRCREGKSLLIERVRAEGHVAEENEDLVLLDPDFRHLELVRISFWSRDINTGEGSSSQPMGDACLGYALLKKDRFTREDPNTGVPFLNDEWHVYEAVFTPYPHQHNYINAKAEFEFLAADRRIAIEGCLYAQQTGVNKTCAQVAIRSIAATYLGNNDLSYRTINSLAAAGNPAFNPSNGLTNEQTSRVLTGLGIDHISVDYRVIESNPDPARCNPTIRDDIPYQKLLYSGIESGCGALMAFSLSGPRAPQYGHIIPFFGHTFNEDSWVPNAEPSYFRIGEHITYIPSRNWLSSFVAHDDNFGANLCIPQSYIAKENVSCVFELLPPGWCYSGVSAEFAAADYFYSILPNVPLDGTIPWLGRLLEYVERQRLILRHVPVSKERYLQDLRERKDWEGNKVPDGTIREFETLITADQFWMVEVSVPEVFPTNKRKLGEILLDASRDLSPETDGTSFVLARLPGYFVFFDSLDSNGEPVFSFTQNQLRSHTRLFSASSPSAS
jgi:hypothetical protein